MEETSRIKETRGEREKRESGGERIKGRGSIMTTKRGKHGRGYVLAEVEENKGEEKKGESS